MQEALREGLQEILKIVKKNPILIEVKDNKLFVGTYTDYHKVIYETNVNHENLKAVISPEIAKDLPNMITGQVSINENNLEIKNEKNKTKIALSEETLSLKDLSKNYEKNTQCSFSGKEFKDAFYYARHASNDKSLGDIVLRGFHFYLTEDVAEIMASNGIILSLVKIQQQNEEFNSSEMLLLNSDFVNLLKLFSDENINVGYNENSITLSSEHENHIIRVITSRTKGDSLPYRDVVKEAQTNKNINLLIEKNELLEKIKQIKVFSQEKFTLTIYNTGEIELSSQGDYGEAKRSLEVLSQNKQLNENLSINLNTNYLYSYLITNKSDTISMNIKNPEAPVFFEDAYGVEIIAPLRK